VSTAEPFTRTQRRNTPTPPLRVGIACDVSGSMTDYTAPVASAAWIIARAAAHVPDAQSATVIYGEHVQPVTRPGKAPARVSEFTAPDMTEQFCDAIDALDHALHLTRPGTARLMVIVSDGCYTAAQYTGGQQKIDRLKKAGFGILWIAPNSPWTNPMTGTQSVTLTHPADTINEIGKAAVAALRSA
jgi:uncharacterized protein with von Willebrand factor type A (vWA) domain